MTRHLMTSVAALSLAFASTPAFAHPDHDDDDDLRADGHAPIGVMGDHRHEAGEIMFSYRFMTMEMDGNRVGTDDISPLEIAQTVPNIFNTELSIPGQPPTLRVVPTNMTMDMHMFGAMWAPTDRVTLMAMVNYIEKEMDHVTFAGMVPPNDLTEANIIGGFTTESSGFGDTKVSALIGLTEAGSTQSHVSVGVSLPTGSIDEEDDVLAPNGMNPTLRLPYPMQLGSGTFDPMLAYTITGRRGEFGYGAQASATWRLYDNDEDYQLGDEYAVTAWASYSPAPWVSGSLRINAMSKGEIEGRDPNIVAPVQTANPDFQGGDRVDLLLGVNLIGQSGAVRGHRLAIEGGVPIYQDLNGPQLETDYAVTAGWQYSF